MVALGARLILPLLLNHVAALRTPELFVALTLLVVLSASWATEHAGLSAALGAFLAGLMVADTPYRHQIAADIAPFRGLFLGLFFMTVGMKVDLGLTVAEPLAVTALVLGIVAVKGVLLFTIALALGYARRLGVQLAGLMAQGSEFSFVLLGIAAATGLLVSTTANLLIVAVAVSMLVTPLLAAASRNWLDRLEGEASSRLARLDAESGELHGHVLIVGFGQVGMALSRHLLGLGTQLLVLDTDSRRVRAARERNLPVYFGNATRTEVLRAAHVEQAAVVVIAVPEPGVASRIAVLAHRLAPAACIIARAPEQSDADALREAGARAVVLDGLTTAVELAERVVIQLETDGTVTV
jgi:CPA2 family monovalent cation:H+ antiporter-2